MTVNQIKNHIRNKNERMALAIKQLELEILDKPGKADKLNRKIEDIRVEIRALNKVLEWARTIEESEPYSEFEDIEWE